MVSAPQHHCHSAYEFPLPAVNEQATVGASKCWERGRSASQGPLPQGSKLGHFLGGAGWLEKLGLLAGAGILSKYRMGSQTLLTWTSGFSPEPPGGNPCPSGSINVTCLVHSEPEAIQSPPGDSLGKRPPDCEVSLQKFCTGAAAVQEMGGPLSAPCLEGEWVEQAPWPPWCR